MRIARELHDVVGHAVRLMVIQASAGRRIAAERPRIARDALDAIDEAGAQALEELTRLSGLLEPDDDGDALSLGELIGSARRAGLDVRLAGDATFDVDPLAFRVVQEALTNVLKHVGRTRVDVVITHEPERVRMVVADRGATTAAGPVPAGGGHGLEGMRERLALAGGAFAAGPTPGGGWEVAASIPTRRPAAVA